MAVMLHADPPASACLPALSLFCPVIGKVEGRKTDHHGHVTALSVSPEYRRLSLASSLMALLEFASATVTHAGYFVDLFVRCNNDVAIDMYEKLGYTVYRRVLGYYSGMEDGGGGRDGVDAFGQHFPPSIRSPYHLD